MTDNGRPGLWASFTRAQVASVTATAVDFGILVALVELAGWWPTAAAAIGACAGAVTNFWMGRQWSFEATHDHPHRQAIRYTVVAAGSLLLNVGGVYLFNELLGVPYVAAKAGTALAVGIFFNFPLHRTYVFR